jgi:sugar phosphate isomerase/epimerase
MRISTRDSGFQESVVDHPLEWAIARVAELGYDGVELRVVPDRLAWGPRDRVRGIWHTEYDADGRRQLRRLAERHGIEIASLACDWTSGFSEYCVDLASWNLALELFEQHVDLAHDLGARVVLVHFGMARGTTRSANRLLGALARQGERAGVVVGVEDSIWHRTGLGERAELRELIKAIGSESLRVYVHLAGDVPSQEALVDATGDLVCGVHSDALERGIDYRPVVDALERVGYDGYWCFEVFGKAIEAAVKAWHAATCDLSSET